MHLRRATWIVTLTCLCLLVAPAAADETPDAAALHAQGKRLLAGGDFQGALRAFRAASLADPNRPALGAVHIHDQRQDRGDEERKQQHRGAAALPRGAE